MKRLILDRGFLDGEQMGRCKKDYGIDILIPLKKNMDVYQDALGLLQGQRVRFELYTPPAPKPPAEAKPTRVPAEILRREKKRQEKRALKKKAERPPLRTQPGSGAKWRWCAISVRGPAARYL
jgi:hypothetical protein